MRRIIGFLFLAGSVSAAFAQSAPHYDSEAYCKTTAGQFGDATMRNFLIQGCREAEAKSAKEVAGFISRIDKGMIDSCDAQARLVAGGSYQGFAGCVALQVANLFLVGKLELIPKPDPK